MNHFRAQKSRLLQGYTGTGKSAELITEVVARLQAGVSPRSVVVFASTPTSAAALKVRLAAALGEVSVAAGEVSGAAGQAAAATLPRVCTMREFALSVLNTEDAYEATGRRARLVTSFEQSFLMEDMKVSGLKIRRLREMLKFFYRSLTELREQEEDFFVTHEERDIYGLLMSHLSFTESVLEPELSNLVVRYLETHPEALAQHSYDSVFIDDYQQLSYASQHLANVVAQHLVVATADPAACIEVYESYPYAAGVEEFAKAYNTMPGRFEQVLLEVCYRSEVAYEAAQHYRMEAGHTEHELGYEHAPSRGNEVTEEYAEAVAPEAFSLSETRTLSEEDDRVVRQIKALLERGVKPAEIAVVGLQPVWSKHFARVLYAAGIPVSVIEGGPVRCGDYRSLEQCQAARTMTLLALMADAKNALAWRAWCGFGDYLGNSAEFDELKTYAEAAGLSLLEALGVLRTNEELRAQCVRIYDAYEAGCVLLNELAEASTEQALALIDEVLELKGKAGALIEVLAGEGFEAQEPRAWWALAEKRCIFPRYKVDTLGELDAKGVLVGSPTSFVGMNPKVVVVPSMVNGAIPVSRYFDTTATTLDQQAKMREADCRTLYTAFGKAGEEIEVLTFKTASLDETARYKLEVSRMGLVEGVMTAQIENSELLFRAC
jgi:superfamily I DNA/RNA helicase